MSPNGQYKVETPEAHDWQGVDPLEVHSLVALVCGVVGLVLGLLIGGGLVRWLWC